MSCPVCGSSQTAPEQLDETHETVACRVPACGYTWCQPTATPWREGLVLWWRAPTYATYKIMDQFTSTFKVLPRHRAAGFQRGLHAK